MFQEIVRLTIQKIFSDKILLGLLIVCLLGFFVGGFSNKDDNRREKVSETRSEAPMSNEPQLPQQQVQLQGQTPSKAQVAPGNYSSVGTLDPALAVEFVRWWMKAAMDYSPKSAVQSHQAASNWMTPAALKNFEADFWNPALASSVSSGSTVGAFQPISVQAEAVNPDHSVVVGLTGTLILQTSNGRPMANQIQMDILVRKGETGLRIDGLYNRLSTLNPSVY